MTTGSETFHQLAHNYEWRFRFSGAFLAPPWHTCVIIAVRSLTRLGLSGQRYSAGRQLLVLRDHYSIRRLLFELDSIWIGAGSHDSTLLEAVHKVRHVRGECVREDVTVCDRGRGGSRACDVTFINFLSYI